MATLYLALREDLAAHPPEGRLWLTFQRAAASDYDRDTYGWLYAFRTPPESPGPTEEATFAERIEARLNRMTDRFGGLVELGPRRLRGTNSHGAPVYVHDGDTIAFCHPEAVRAVWRRLRKAGWTLRRLGDG